jgi:hypothetical protein
MTSAMVPPWVRRMTAPLLVLFAFTAGAATATAARRALRRAPEPMQTRYALVAALLAALVFTPGGLALYLLAPDWSLMYLAHPDHLGGPLMLGVLFLHYALGPVVGFWGAAQLARRDERWLLSALFGAMGVLFASTLLLGWRALTTVAHHDAYHHGGATLRFGESSLFLPAVLIAAASASAVVYATMHVRRHADIGEALPERPF